MFSTKIRLTMLTPNFPDKLLSEEQVEMNSHMVISRVNFFQKMQYKMT